MQLLTSPGSDDLSTLLGRINVRSVVYCLSDLGAPWGFRVDGSATAKFHLVIDGQATLTLDDPGATRVTLAAGEHDPGMVLDAYLLRSLAVAGYAPSFGECARCGAPGPRRP